MDTLFNMENIPVKGETPPVDNGTRYYLSITRDGKEYGFHHSHDNGGISYTPIGGKRKPRLYKSVASARKAKGNIDGVEKDVIVKVWKP